jgi:patatin-like phospholipase/acyl hydrolase
MQQNKFKILTLDGGGSKGVYSLGILHEIEKKLGSPLIEHFDCFYGSSTGAIIAALLAQGRTVSEIKELYLEKIPPVMQKFFPNCRQKKLKVVLDEVFDDKKFDSFQKYIGIVTTSLDEKNPKIFKSNVSGSHGRKSSFEPGFGCTIADALLASCAARPFFPNIILQTNITKLNLMDGGFAANNPTIFAIIDALKAFQVNPENLRVINIGTGEFPFKLSIPWPISRLVCWFTDILEINSNTMALIIKLLLQDIKVLRISETFNQPNLETNILEHDLKKLESLFVQGQRSFGNKESEFDALIN